LGDLRVREPERACVFDHKRSAFSGKFPRDRGN